jgi:hypothetical protein
MRLKRLPKDFSQHFPDDAQQACDQRFHSGNQPGLYLRGEWRPASFDSVIGRWIPDVLYGNEETLAWVAAHRFVRKSLAFKVQSLLGALA